MSSLVLISLVAVPWQAGPMKNDAALNITFRKLRTGAILVTARVVTPEDVRWYRVTLPEGTDLPSMYRKLVLQALLHLEKAGGPATRMVSYQGMLPAGGG